MQSNTLMSLVPVGAAMYIEIRMSSKTLIFKVFLFSIMELNIEP